MPTNGRPKLTVRLDEETQRRFTAAAYNAGTDGATVLREVIAWYLWEPGAELPQRPDRTEP